jgi:hypothetical protein
MDYGFKAVGWGVGRRERGGEGAERERQEVFVGDDDARNIRV